MKEQITLIIPCRNEEKYIDKLFESILNQDYDRKLMEVLFIDGSSQDRTVELLTSRIKSSPESREFYGLKILHNTYGFVPHGLNMAIREAKFDTIIRLDSHSEYEHEYISKLVHWKNKLGAQNVGGVVHSDGRTNVGRAISTVMSSKYGMGNALFRVTEADDEPILVDTVPFGIFSRKFLNEIGLFDERFIRHQDYELNYRIRSNGGKIFLVPSITIRYYVRDSFRALYRQFKGYGTYKGRFIRMNNKAIKIRHLVPIVFVLAFIVSLILLVILQSKLGLFVFGLVTFPYLVLLMLVSFKMFKENKVNLWYCAIALVIIHTVWGVFTIKGYLSKRWRKKKYV